MQLYVLDRAKNTLATTASFYNDKHHKELTAGASIFEFTIDKSDSAAQYMTTGNYLVFLDDRGRAWSFTILSYDETQTTKTVAAEDVSIELLNKAMDVWNTDQAYPFSYYFNLVTKGTPWKLGVNQLTDLSRKLVYTGRDTGLGRLLSILKGFDNAECQFNIKVQQNKPVEFVVDVYKSIGTVQDNIQIVYNNELNDIKKTESRAQFVTALAGIGGLVENQATTDPGLEKHIDFTDIDYKDDNFMSPKGDKFLRAVTANRTFNPGTTTYIEDFYDYDTQSAQELLNRTLTQLKERSEPQYTYNADVKVIDPTLDIGDTVTIIDHDYNPALYLQARVATLDKSYTDPTQGAITFCNYRLLNSNLSDQLRAMQNIIDQLPTSASIKVINNNIVQMITDNAELKKQVALSFESANGKSRVWFSRSSTAQDGDIAFIKNADGATEIWKFVEGAWKLDTGLATFEDVKKAASVAADAGSQAAVAGQQASTAGADAKSAGDFAASAASQSTIETAAAQSAANSAVNQANLAISQAGFANNAADQAKSAAASAQSDAADALAEATKSFNDAQNAISNATKAMDAAEQNHTTVTGLVTKVDDIAGTIQTLATTQSVDKLAGTVTTVQNLAQFAADGLKLKADTTTVNQINGTVNDLKGELDVQADKIAATVTASDVTGMLGNYATQSWSQGQISAAKNEITASVETVQTQVDNSAVGTNLYTDTKNFDNLSSWWGSNLWTKTTDTYKGLAVVQTTDPWGGLSQYIQVKKGDILTYSVYAKYISGTGTSVIYWQLDSQTEGSYSSATTDINNNTVNITDSWQRISGTIVATSDGYLRPRLERTNNNTNTLQIAGTKLEKGSKATDWQPAPEDQATVDWTKAQLDIKDTKISAAVTSLKSDITNATAGMATQTWTQGKLDLTADGLTSQISSVQNGLNEKYTSLEQTLSGVQVTANNAITQGQLSLLSDQLTSTITGVKNDLNNMQVGGRNLYFDTKDINNIDLWYANKYWTKQPDKYNGLAVMQTTDDWSGLSQYVKVKTGEVYTFSLYARYTSGTGVSNIYWQLDRDMESGYASAHVSVANKRVDLSDNWQRISVTTTITADGYIRPRIERTADNDNILQIAGMKLERGNVATDWSPAPEDQATVADVSSQFTQLQNDINLRVKTGDLVSQIDVNTKRILLDGASTYITNTTHIDTGVIKTAMIADAAIDSAKIANAAIDNAKIANASITAAKIADLAIGSAQIADGAISTAKIGTAAITSAQIADASILDAKIVNLDGSKIVAHSITADQLDVNAIAVGLNTYGAGWQITPASIAFLPVGTTHTTISLSGDMGITYGDLTTGEILGHTYGTPYNTKAGMDWFNGISTVLKYNGADYWAVLSEESDSTVRPRLTYSNRRMAELGVFQGWTFDDNTHFATIGPMDSDDNAQMKVVRLKIGDRWATGFKNSNTNAANQAGIAFTDDGATFFGRSGVWWNLYDILKKQGANV